MSRSKYRHPLITRTITGHKEPGIIWFDSPRGLGHRVSRQGASSFVLLCAGPNGKQQPRKIASGDTPIDAVREITLAKLTALARGENPFAEKADAPLLSQVMEDHIHFLETKGNQRHGRRLDAKTAARYRTSAERWLKVDHFNRLRSDALTRGLAAHWLGRLRTESGLRTAQEARAMLVAALRLQGLDVSAFLFTDTKARQGKPRLRVLSTEEFQRWQTAVEAAPLRWRVFFTLLSRTGLRPRELATSRRDSYDLTNATLTIDKARRGKSDTPVTVTLDEQCVAELKQLWNDHPPFAGYAFPSLKKVGSPVYNYHGMFTAICKAAKLSDVQARDLRRTFGTYAALSNLSAEQISAALGNTSAVTSRTYIQLASNPQVIANVQSAVSTRMDAAIRGRRKT